ncbi:hypothetical protein ACPF8X_34580 [Streptomyces sp. G35A]
MRLCTPVSFCLAAVAVVLPVAAPAHAEAPLPACASPDDRGFPLTARIHGGPASYTAGGGFGTWYLELTNTTGRACAGVHPVVVLVDEERALKPSQPVLEFYDGEGRPHPVRLETTDRDELVGAFAAEEEPGFAGFTVGPRKTLTVRVRLAVTSDAVPNEVTANAAVVQRHEDDGDWIGQSNDYRFRIDAAPAPETEERERGERETGEREKEEPETGEPEKEEPSREEGNGEERNTEQPEGREDEAGTREPDADVTTAAPAPREDRPLRADELASTGSGGRALAFATAAVLAGSLAVRVARRRR